MVLFFIFWEDETYNHYCTCFKSYHAKAPNIKHVCFNESLFLWEMFPQKVKDTGVFTGVQFAIS